MAFDAEGFLKDAEKIKNGISPEQDIESSKTVAENATTDTNGKGFWNRPFYETIPEMFNPSAEERQQMYDAAIAETQQIDINPDENEENPGVDAGLAAKNEQARAGFVQFVENKASDANSMDIFRDLHAASIFHNYIMTPEEKFNKAREIARETGLTTDAILEDDTTYKNAMALYDYTKKSQAAMGKDQRLDYKKVLQQFPELENIADMDDEQMVMALHDMSNIRELHNLFNDNKSLWRQYKDYADAVLERGKYEYGQRREWYKVAEMKDAAAAFDKAEALSIEAREKPALIAPNIFNDPLKAVIYGVGTNMPQQLHDMIEGGGIGAVLGGVAGLTIGAATVALAGTAGVPISIGSGAFIGAATLMGAREGFWVGNFNAMNKDFEGEHYQQLYENRNANGRDAIHNHSFTHAEMQENARLTSPVNTFWEVADQRLFMNIVTPGKKIAEKSFLESLEKLNNKMAREQAIDKAASEASKKVGKAAGRKAADEAAKETIVKESALDFAKEELPTIAKVPIASSVGEGMDEALQSATSDLMENKLKAETGRGGRLMTADEILTKAGNSFIGAMPGGFGFGFMGVPMHAFSATTGLTLNIQRRVEDQQRYTEEARHTIFGVNWLAGVQRIVGESKLNNENDAQAQELQRKIIREQAEGSGFEMVYIDTASVLETENGQEQLEKIAKAAGMDEAALQAAVQNGNLSVPIESFAQAQADNSVLTSISFSEHEDSIAEMNKNANELARQQQENLQRAKEDIEKIKNIIATQYFPNDAEAANEALIAMYDNPTNPAAGLREIEKNLQEAKLHLIQPALDRLKQGFGNGVDIVTDDEGRGIRVSNNEQWYQDWYAKNQRNITQADLTEMAEALMTGESNAPDIEGWRLNEAEYNAAQDMREQLQEINKELDIVSRTKEKLAGLSAAEVQNAIGLTPEAFSVYRTIKEDLEKGPGTSSRAARLNAIIFARHADRFAERYTRASGRKFTAVDYYNRVKVAFDGTQAGGFAQPMYDVRKAGAKSVLDLYDRIKDRQAKKMPENKIMFFDAATGISFYEERITHGENDHDFTRQDYENIYKAIKNGISDVHLSDWGHEYGGQQSASVIGKIENNGQYYVLSLEYLPNGDIIYKTAFPQANEKAADAYIKDKGASMLSPADADAVSTGHLYTPLSIQKSLGNVKFNQMAGAKAANAPLGKLEQAKAMLQDGKDAHEIWRATGWMRGKDKKWRFEIADNLDAINLQPLLDGKWHYLGDIYQNDKLYEAYPRLADISIIATDEVLTADGFYNGEYIGINLSRLKENIDGDEHKKTLVHEIQHVIQGYEDFATGGSPRSVMMQIVNQQKSLEEKITKGLSKDTAYNLMDLLGKYHDAVSDSNGAIIDGDVKSAIQFADSSKKIKAEIQELHPEKNIEEILELYNDWSKLNQIQRNNDSIENLGETQRKLYRLLAGEQEARQAELRADVNTENIRAALKQGKIAGEIGLQYEKLYNAAPQELKELADEYAGILESNTTETADIEANIARMNEIEASASDLEHGQELIQLLSDYAWEHAGETEAWKDAADFSDMLPRPHNFDAIIVFNGQEFGAASIIGETGAANLDKAQEINTRLDNLAAARQMEEAKKDAKTIKLATGWERGADGKWRYEVKEPKLTKEFYDLDHTTKNGMKLADVIADGMDSELLKAYPQLADWRVKFTVKGRKQGEAGETDIEKHVIKLSEYLLSKDDAEEVDFLKAENYAASVEGVLMHEIQHAIQEMEGFAPGASPEYYAQGMELADAKFAIEEAEYNLSRVTESIAKGLLNGARMENESLLPAIAKRLAESDATLEEIVKEFSLPEKAIWDMPRALYNRILPKRKAALDRIKERYNPVNRYHRTAGEVEARNVQTRMDMSWADRQKTLLAETEDVAREDQIFLRDGEIGSSFARQMNEWLEGRDGQTDTEHILHADNAEIKTAGDLENAELTRAIPKWQQKIDEYKEIKNKDSWLYTHGQELNTLMHMPLVFKLLGIDDSEIKYKNKFYSHAVRNAHHGMDFELLKEVPEKLIEPIMVIKGAGKNQNFVFVLDKLDNDKATMLSVVYVQQDENGELMLELGTTYGKTSKEDKSVPDYTWFEDRIRDGHVLYLDIEKSTAWASVKDAARASHPELSSALDELILSDKFKEVKTKTDLDKLKSENVDSQRLQQYKDAQENGALFQETKGSTSPMSDGTSLIQLFETADESTFLHEMGHLFLLDLEELAGIDAESAEEFAKVREWAEWKQGDYKKYKGTPWAKEFADREQEIIDATNYGFIERTIIEKGQKRIIRLTADEVKREWLHERFARGFEIYLKDGKAPSKGLRAVFRSFAKFLRQVYAAFLADGAKASKDVERIMGRMIATDEEIEAMKMDDQFRDIEKAGGEKLLNETEKETYDRWLSEAQEEAREKLMKIVMKDITDKQQAQYNAMMQQMEAKYRRQHEQDPIHLARAAIKSLGGDKQGALVAYPSITDFEKDDAVLPTLDEEIAQLREKWDKTFEEQYLKDKLSEEKVREAMESSAYFHKAQELVAAAMARKLDLKNKINSKVEQAMQGIQDALDALPEQYDLQNDKNEDPVKAVIAKINQLRFSAKWNYKDFAEIEKMIKAASREELQQQMKEFKENIKKQKIDMRALEKANEGRMKQHARMAAEAIAKQEIYNATNVNEYRRHQRQKEAKVRQAVKRGDMQEALNSQQFAALSAAMAKEAAKAKEKVDKLLANIDRQLNAKSVKLPARERYWHRHLIYQLRIGLGKDVDKPVLKNGQQLGTLTQLIEGYKDRLDLAEDYDVDSLVEIIERNEKQAGYKTMTLDEFERVAELLNMIYKCGKDEFSLKTIAGKSISEAVEEIIGEKSLADRTEGITRRRFQDNTGGLGWNDWAARIPKYGEKWAKYGQDYLSVTMKPEKLIEMLGKKAHAYIYGTFDKAVNDEAEKMAKAVDDVQAILAGYSHADRQAWKDIKYEIVLPTPEGGTETARCSKENIICMALNLGTEANRQRLTGGFYGPESGQDEAQQKLRSNLHTIELERFCSQHMTKQDWKMVQKIWNYLDTYWPDTARVEEELNGRHLDKQEAYAFTVVTPDGEKIDMQGGYYPIVFNKDKDIDAAAHAQDDVAKQQGGSQKVLGMGRSHVKSRSEYDVFRELQLTFDTIPNHLQQVIHNITTRLAARDVKRLLDNAELKEYIEENMGAPYVKILNDWSLDVWRQAPENDAAASLNKKMIGALRRNSVYAIMAYRVWPALENFSNIGPVADRLGWMNALSAVTEFYGHMSDFGKLLDKSVLMRNRINNMDRDIRSQAGLFNADNKIMETIREHGYDLMTYSDLMFSAPLWCRAFKQNYMETYQEVMAENIANKKKQQEAQDKLDKLRGDLIDAKKDIQDWHAEKSNRARAGQVGWQPGTSRFAVMSRHEFNVLLPELVTKQDELSRMLWEAEAEQGRAAEIKIFEGEALIKEVERRCVAKADAAVRDAFGSGRAVDLAAVSRSTSELTKIMTTFYAFFNTQFNAIYFKYLEGKYNSSPNFSTWENMQAWLPFAKSVMNRLIIPSLIGSLLKMAIKLDGDSDRDKWRKVKKDGKVVKEEIPWLERFLKVFGRNTLSMGMGAFYGVRDIGNLVISMAFDGSYYGRGINIASAPVRSLEEGIRMIQLICSKSARDAEIDEKEAAEQEKLRKMNPRQRAKYEENKKYKKPRHRITYAEIFRHGANMATGMTAATTGVSSTLIDAVTGTMEYMLDTENRYDANWRNVIWSAIFDKRPVEKEIPQKPEQPKKRKKKK